MDTNRYEAARVVAKLAVFVGCLVFACGIFATMTAGAAGGTVAALVGLPTTIGGLLTIAAGQMTGAVLDIADDTRKTAEAARRILAHLDDARSVAGDE